MIARSNCGNIKWGWKKVENLQMQTRLADIFETSREQEMRSVLDQNGQTLSVNINNIGELTGVINRGIVNIDGNPVHPRSPEAHIQLG